MSTTSASRLPGEEPTRDPRYCAGAMRGVLLQTEAAEQFRGRIFGAFTTTTSLLPMCGVLVAGALGDRLGVLPVPTHQGSMHVLVFRHRTGVAWCDKQQSRP